ncbi:MAG TPA: FAD-dependent oxidoreductase, partial [Vicinamibacteria bacterium]|nr:FAD-dependent oxidoreductase [Vicinamibacteria bacterium]
MDSRASSAPRVVIVGGGFAGLTAARTLRRAPVQITLVDRHNHHVFQPLLYQVATAGLSSTNIAAPLRHILRRQRNATVLLADATGVDLRRQRLILRDGELPYDFLVLAAGATHSYFGHEEWSRHAPGLKTLNDAIDIRRRVLLAFEEAERETDEARRAEWLTFVVIGAGPTGVEMAGTLAE